MANYRATCHSKLCPSADPTYYCSSRWWTYAKATPLNGDELSVAKHLADMVREPITHLTCSKIDAMLKKEKPPLHQFSTLSDKVVGKLNPSRYSVPKFQKLNGRKGDPREDVAENLVQDLRTQRIPYHRKGGHALERRIPFIKIFYEKHRSGEVSFRRADSINDCCSWGSETIES